MPTTFTLHSITPDKLNSATKYPSIPTYHQLNNDGGLTEPTIAFTGPVLATEKVDGVNARLIVFPDESFALGSREELLYAQGDYLANPAHGLVDTLLPVAIDLDEALRSDEQIRVFYFELYGGAKLTPASKDYTSTGQAGLRLFDIAVITQHVEIAEQWTVEQIAAWRDRGGPAFVPEALLEIHSRQLGIPLTPRLLACDASELPTDIDKTHDWLTEHAATTRVALDEQARGRSEGIVLRTPDRSTIAKLRFQNYNRTRQLRDQATRSR